MGIAMTTSASAIHTVRITADRFGCGVKGRETMTVEHPVSLDAMLQAQQLQRTGVLEGAQIDADGIYLRKVYTLKDAAQHDIMRVCRSMRFLAYTGMRPAAPDVDANVRALVDGMPGKRVIAAVWTHAVTGAWVAAVTTEPATGERGEWLRTNGISSLPPGWTNVWAQGAVVPHLLCSDQATAAALADGLDAIQATGPLVWTGKSETIERAAKTAPKVTRAPAATRTGRFMTLERHFALASIVSSLLASHMHALALEDIRAVRRELVARLENEHPGVGGVALYSGRIKGAPPIAGRDRQIDQIDHAVQILEIGYGRSKLRDELTRGLRRARARLAVSRAPREQSPASAAA